MRMTLISARTLVTTAGNVTVTVFGLATTPSPPHGLQRVLMTPPRPPQRAHGAVNMTKPRAFET
jgi:hypothetical protein